MTELEKINGQLEKAMSELRELEIEETQLAYDYIEYANILVKKLIIGVVNYQREQLKEKNSTTIKEFAIELLDISDNPENSNKEWKKIVLENSIAKIQEELLNL